MLLCATKPRRTRKKRSLVWPIHWNKCRRLGPRLLNQRVLEPLIAQVRMLSDDKLEAWNIVLSELKQQLEQSAHCIKIGVGFRFLHRTISIFVDLLGREVDLGWLVDQ